MAAPLRVNTAELLRRPGSTKDVVAELLPASIGLVDGRFDAEEPVVIGLHLEAMTDGIVVRGTIVGTWHGECRRCALPATGTLHCDVHELYQEVVTDPEAFELTGDQLDLAPMVREVLVLDAPVTPLCRPDCRGLCPQCGTDRNMATCDCVTDRADPRWAALQSWDDARDD